MLMFYLNFVYANPIGLDMFSNQKEAIKEYKQALGMETSGNKNYGLALYNLELLESNFCFRSQAIALYSELKSVTSGVEIPNTINDSLPQKSFDAGFLWTLALKHSGDDPNLALALIGVCGHDDTQQLGNEPPSSANYVSANKGVPCPLPNSPIYTPGALHGEANISPEIKTKIKDSQGDNGDTSFIPAKYYHVLAAASTSCILMRRNVPAPLAKITVTTAVNGYRASRLCLELLGRSENNKTVQILEGILTGNIPMPRPINLNSVIKSNSKVEIKPLNNPAAPPSADNSLINESHKSLFNLDMYSPDVKKELNNYLHLFVFEPNIVKQKITRVISYINAKKILFGTEDMVSDCDNPPYLKIVGYLKERKFLKPKKCSEDLSTQRCNEAIQRLETWAVDREWTEAQHLAGFEFSRNNCQPTFDENDSLEKLACRAKKNSKYGKRQNHHGATQNAEGAL